MTYQKFMLFVSITIIFIGAKYWVNGDVKVLGNVRLAVGRSNRDETISLDSDSGVVVKGFQINRYQIKNDDVHIIKAIIDYVADKNGYQANYTINFVEDIPDILHLDPKTLMSLAG